MSDSSKDRGCIAKKGRRRNTKLPELAGVCALGYLFMVGCAPSGTGAIKRTHWSETIEIAPTETIKVDRTAEFTIYQLPGEEYPAVGVIVDEKITVYDSGTTLPLSTKHLVPILMHRDPATRDLILVASTDDCVVWAKNGRPPLPYWAFRLREGRWYRTALPGDALGRKANMMMDLLPFRAELSAEEVQERRWMHANRDIPPRFRQVSADGALRNCGGSARAPASATTPLPMRS